MQQNRLRAIGRYTRDLSDDPTSKEFVVMHGQLGDPLGKEKARTGSRESDRAGL